MRTLLIGDVVGRPGRKSVQALLGPLREELDLDFVVANGENAAGGTGITPRTFEELRHAGVDVVTTGNHVYRQRGVLTLFEADEGRLLRPANFSARAPGRGFTVATDRRGRRVAVLNLQGRVYMPPAEDPFATVDRLLEGAVADVDAVLVDFHAEATSEKVAFGWHLDGRVSLVAGTHTHIPTADERVLPGGTAYVTDVGMTGPHESCLGVKTDIILEKFRTGLPVRFQVASGDRRLQAVLVEIDDRTGLAKSIERVERVIE